MLDQNPEFPVSRSGLSTPVTANLFTPDVSMPPRKSAKPGWLAGIACLLLLAAPARGTDWYVDNTATGANNGTSWADAWTSVQNARGVQPGDTVYISGGTTSQTYTGVLNWVPIGGVQGNPVTYRIGQDAGHNGTAHFVGPGSGAWIFPLHVPQIAWVTIDGNYGGSCHIEVDNYDNTLVCDKGAVGLVLRYIKATPQLRAYGCNQIEYDHLVLGPRMAVDRQIVGLGSGTGFSNNSIHDCTIYAYYQHGLNSKGGNGDDCMANINAVTVKNCRFIGVYTDKYTGSQHQDGIQADDWIWVEGCYFENMANYCLYFEYFHSGGHDYVFNNVFNYSDPVLSAQPTQAINAGSHNPTDTLSDVIIANNTIHGGKNAIVLAMAGEQPLSGCAIVNNLLVDNNGITAPRTQSANLVMLYNKAVRGGATVFSAVPGTIRPPDTRDANMNPVAFVNPAKGDFHLAAADGGAKYAGTSWPSVYIKTDKDGNPRPRASAWSLGAYEYGDRSSARRNLRIAPAK